MYMQMVVSFANIQIHDCYADLMEEGRSSEHHRKLTGVVGVVATHCVSPPMHESDLGTPLFGHVIHATP